MKDVVISNMNKFDNNLSKYATLNKEAVRFKNITEDFRPPFFRDADKIIYSLAYIRYIDKTQVYSNNENDMISKRMTHVQMVSKIARTIGRALNLNEDLIEAASLGHDLGHVPYGHVGEKILNKLSLKYNEGYFNHNVQSVRNLMYLENEGQGSNITLQVLDAIFCHNGEILESEYSPKNKTQEEFLKEYEESYKNQDILKKVRPMTLEGCVVRISDIIGYIGKDIEDAMRLGKIKKDDIPKEIIDVFGYKNTDIVNTLVEDIITNSLNKNSINMSNRIYKSLKRLIDFNYQNIYLKANTKEDISRLEYMFSFLFETYYNQIINNSIDEDIFTVYLNNMCDDYKSNTTPARIVIDYISGMTDDFFNNQFKKYSLHSDK